MLFFTAVQQAIAVTDVHSDLNFYQCTYRLCDTDGIRRYHIQVMVGRKRIIPPSDMWASDQDYGHVETLAIRYGRNCRDIYVRVYSGAANEMTIPINLVVTVRHQHQPMVMTRSCVLPVSTTNEVQAGTTPMPATAGLQFNTTQMGIDESPSNSSPMQVAESSPEISYTPSRSGSQNLYSLFPTLTLSVALLASWLFV